MTETTKVRVCRPGPGFTLVELLVVIAIIGILVALLLPPYRPHAKPPDVASV